MNTMWRCLASQFIAATLLSASCTSPVLSDEVPVPVSQESTQVVAVIPAGSLSPDKLAYLGAFRLPVADERPDTFEYGGEAMTYRPGGDALGPDDGTPGSLFVMGHNRLPYGELPDGNRVAEIAIPAPVLGGSPDELPQATLLQPFADIDTGVFSTLDEIPRVGMEYLETPSKDPRIHLAWGQHLQEDDRSRVASQASISCDLSGSDLQGPWRIGGQPLYAVNDYLFEIPAEWAESYAHGRRLATGRYRDGGWSGMGPQLFAYRSWDDDGAALPPGSTLEATVLLAYGRSDETDAIERCLDGYQHADEWTGGAWLTTSSGGSAVLFAGTKATGHRYWYGFISPEGPDQPCVEPERADDPTACRMADGTPCPPAARHVCAQPTSNRGWWSSSFAARFILYDPGDLARVATGMMQPWEPQPYAYIDIDEHLFGNPAGIEREMLGAGAQRRFRLGDIAFDRDRGLLYVLELFADDARPVVHVWSVG